MAVSPKEPFTGSGRTFVGGLLGGILGTSGMLFVGLAAEGLAGLPPDQGLTELELGFGGPVAGAGHLGPGWALPVHYLHGAVLGVLFAGLILLGERWRIVPPIPLWADGVIFGAVVTGFVILLLDWTDSESLTFGLVGLVGLLHLTFGGLAGLALARLRAFARPSTAGPVSP